MPLADRCTSPIFWRVFKWGHRWRALHQQGWHEVQTQQEAPQTEAGSASLEKSEKRWKAFDPSSWIPVSAYSGTMIKCLTLSFWSSSISW